MTTTHAALFAFLSLTVPTAAQSPATSPPAADTPAPELLPWLDVFGGLTLVRMEPGPDLDRESLAGWYVSGAIYSQQRVGLVAEVSWARRTRSLEAALAPDAQVRLTQQTFLIGPSFRIVQRARLNTSVRTLVGVARNRAAFPSDLEQVGIVPGQTPASIGVFENETVFAATLGSAWDITLSRTLALRVSPSLLLSRFGDETQVTTRLSTGVVFRFNSPKPN